jgi:hypothetical protein
VGGVHRRHPHSRPARLGAPRRARGVVDGPSHRSRARRVVRRRPPPLRGVLPRGDRLGPAALAVQGGAPDETRWRVERRAGGDGRRRTAERERER